mmetsp:Transcript_938/g.3017  ORF Transcript_938/g.3017 Transcript_938/m.3017 type:complete len:323 (+) Transcript_938:1283-2251(+)
MVIERESTELNVSPFNGGMWYSSLSHAISGKEPFKPAMSPTVGVDVPPMVRASAHSIAVPTTMAMSAEGTRFVSRGKRRQTKKEAAVIAPAQQPSAPDMNGTPSVKASKLPKRRPSEAIAFRRSPTSLKLLNCARPMTSANPLQKPIITGVGINFTRVPTRNKPKTISMIPITITATNKYSTPCPVTVSPTSTQSEPVAPQIIAGLPPNTAVNKAMIHAECKPMDGVRPADKANATASGTNAKATVMPHMSSNPRFAPGGCTSASNAPIAERCFKVSSCESLPEPLSVVPSNGGASVEGAMAGVSVIEQAGQRARRVVWDRL